MKCAFSPNFGARGVVRRKKDPGIGGGKFNDQVRPEQKS